MKNTCVVCQQDYEQPHPRWITCGGTLCKDIWRHTHTLTPEIKLQRVRERYAERTRPAVATAMDLFIYGGLHA